MSIEDFDNGAPDNRPVMHSERAVEAARYDERRKIWHAFGMTGDPPEDLAAMVAMSRPRVTRRRAFSDLTSEDLQDGIAQALAEQDEEIATIRRVLVATDEETTLAAAERVACAEIRLAIQVSDLRARLEAAIHETWSRLSIVYTALTGEVPGQDWNVDTLVERCVRVIHDLANVDPELHEDVTAHVVGDVALRSEPLARAVVRLLSLPDPVHVHYLRLDHDGGADWYQESRPPRFGLSADLEVELSTKATAALAAGDGAEYLDVLRQVADECQMSVRPPDALAVKLTNVSGRTITLPGMSPSSG